jgi:mono/diheme cytochrome c family protein
MRFAAALFSALLLISTCFAQTKPAARKTATKLEHGKYLVERVAGCVDCHTPFNEKGEPVRERWLRGAKLPFKPIVPMPVWADRSPNIAGLPGWTDEDAIKFFMTGLAYNDLPARPPMPQYRLSRADAEAVVAYLRSLDKDSSSEPTAK